MFSFDNSKILLIGGGQNIGREIALEFARRGATLAVADINLEGAEETAQAINAAGGKAKGISCDISDDASVQSAVDAAKQYLGGIDVLINNAGIMCLGNPEDIPVQEWQRLFNINLFGAVRTQNAVLPDMLAQGYGYIVNTASFAGLYPYAANRMPYAASKAALISLSQNMALYLEPQGINVSCLCPGPVMTTMTDGVKPWSEDVAHRGPGKDLDILSQRAVAGLLADAMEKTERLILTHEKGWANVANYGSGPNQFMSDQLSRFAAGDNGVPVFKGVPE